MTDLLVGVGSISGVAPVKPGSPVQWMGSDEQDDPNLACGYTPSLDVNNTQLYQFDAVAYESVIIGLFSIITGKRCSPPRPFKRGGEQDAVYLRITENCSSVWPSIFLTDQILSASEI
jgi:hypothetical protein|eukprot:SAG25_NODE_293_length_10288_cov_2.565904_6_plen_118_part_00